MALAVHPVAPGARGGFAVFGDADIQHRNAAVAVDVVEEALEEPDVARVGGRHDDCGVRV